MIKYFSQTRVINMEQTQTEKPEIEIVKQRIVYYEVCVNVHRDGTRVTTTNPIDIDSDGVDNRHIHDGTTIIACVPATYEVYSVYMIEENGEKSFIGYELPSIDIDWQREAHKYIETHGICDKRIRSD